MLSWNLRSVCKARGIEHPYTFFVKAGLPPPTATAVLNNNNSRIVFKYLELLCKALNCTPDNLFKWEPGPSETLPENHQLFKLKPLSDQPFDLLKTLKDVPIEKLRELTTTLSNDSPVEQ
jgi:hypothetical protein